MLYSDLNNVNVITTTSEQYETAFGFTEEEVFASLDLMGLSKGRWKCNLESIVSQRILEGDSGVKREQIRCYGFAFCGKKVLIG